MLMNSNTSSTPKRRISRVLLAAAVLSECGYKEVNCFAPASFSGNKSPAFATIKVRSIENGKQSQQYKQGKAATVPQHWLASESLSPNPLTLRQSSCTTNADDPMNNRHSASDWLYNIKSFPQSKVLREIRNPVIAVAAWSFLVSLVHKIGTSASWAHPALRYVTSNMCISGTAHSFLVSALGLLLVFRTNSAYQRFNEGRKIWENILSVSRNLSRMIQLYSTEFGDERKQRILNLVAAYPYLLRQHIRPGCLCAPPEQHIPKNYKLLLQENYSRRNLPETRHEGQEELLSTSYDFMRKVSNNLNGDEPDAEEVCAAQCWVDRRHLPWCLFKKSSLPQIARAENRPLWVCDRIGAVIMTIPYGPNFTSRERLTLLKMVDSLTNAVGQCERIHQTAVPLNYARHSLRSLTLWLFTLPFALVQDMGLFTAVVNACIAWLLFGVYQIGYSIEDPFQGSLRLSILCDAIRRNVIGQSEELRDSAFRLINDAQEFTATQLKEQRKHDFTKGMSPETIHPIVIDKLETMKGLEFERTEASGVTSPVFNDEMERLVDEKLLKPPTFVVDSNDTYSAVRVAL